MFKPTKVAGAFSSARGIRTPEDAQQHVGSFSRGRGRGRTGRYNTRLGSRHSNTELNAGTLLTRQAEEPTNLDQKFEDVKIRDEIDERLGFRRYHEGSEKLGWLINMHSTLVKDPDWPGGRAAVDYYFLEEDGRTFKCTLLYQPYFFIGCKPGSEADVEDYLRRRFDRTIEKVKHVKKDDLKQQNHLLGYNRTFLQLIFRNVADLLTVRKLLLLKAKENQAKMDIVDAYADIANTTIDYEQPVTSRKNPHEVLDNVIDIREYDVPYYLRVAIDNDIRVGLWYTVQATQGSMTLTRRHDLVKRAEPVVLAFDIEVTKLPLKFPDATIDSIMMISYMIDGQGYLITNRDIVSQDIDDFEYTPKPEFEGPFTIFNEPDELSLLRRFFEHILEVKPTVFVTYNGDSFDWPFVEARAKLHGIDIYQEIGFYKDDQDEYKSNFGIHMDAFRWVKRDSYLPQGSQGLKAVTTAKLGYNPMELDPEDMTRFASEQPQTLAQYSVSDAVATYYLYMKYVHPFIFSLCNIIPLCPDEVLRKGSGTLCEILLMVEAYKANVIMPNKHVDEIGKMYDGHLLESETYVGGHVEALEAGVFRSDIPTKFKIVPEAVQQLIEEVDQAMKFFIEVEEKKSLSDIINYDEIRNEIIKKLEELRDNSIRQERPRIYHLDVAAMYPNIILTNRLQPDALIDEAMCAGCDFNRPGKTCDRRMEWLWRGEYFPAKRNELNMIKNQLMVENFPPKRPNEPPRQWHSLSEVEQASLVEKRLSDYCRKVYRKVRETRTVERTSIICQRENPFYIETVRAFRDRRYEYKGLHKKWKKNLDDAAQDGSLAAVDEAKKMIVLYDSLQLAHKCILNSFYGYVMRKGARWYSMEMAGITCYTGSTIIQMARQLVEQIGRPLELDTDGIWCILPANFPENFALKLTNGKSMTLSYPCTMLNHRVHARFTNHQYQELSNPETHEYLSRSENSIFFEVDGPYRAMILPSSKEEDKLLKKRYAVFHEDGSLAELKGFEVKRRGELKLIKIFQSQIFKVFLEGSTLEECYAAVAKVADQWLDVLYSKGANLEDEELVELISENRSMSKTLEDYGAQKSTSISTAKRLAEFLGDQMVKDKGLACKFIISAKPFGAPVTERAIPIAIFTAESSVRKHFLRKWLKDNGMTSFDIRDILDWPYYLERLGSVIQKLITIPAALQKVPNPVPRVRHPDWLFKRVASKDDKFKQHRITDMFKKAPVIITNGSEVEENGDLQIMETQQLDVKSKSVLVIDDLEDLSIGKNRSILRNGLIVPTVRKALKRMSTSQPVLRKSVEKELTIENRDMPNMYEDYSAWLQFQKQKWKRQRENRQRSYGASPQQTLARSTSNSVSGFLRKQAGSLVSSPWQVIQIVETEIAGEFRMWVLIQKNMYMVRLSVPRVFYVNSHETEPTEGLRHNPSCQVQRRVRTLPRSHQCLNLFELTMPESVFQAEQKKFASFFNHPSTEGVYETQVPLLTRALLKLGCVCIVDRKNKPDISKWHLEDRFHLEDLAHRGSTILPYLEEKGALSYLYLYHTTSDSRHFLALVPTALDKAYVFIVGASKQNDQMPNLNRLYMERLAEYNKDPSKVMQNIAFDYKDEMDFDVGYYQNEKEAIRAIQRTIEQYQEARKGPTVLVVHSPRSLHALLQNATILLEFPSISIPSHKSDNRFNALDWIRPVARRMIVHFLHLGSWITEKQQLARYADIPFCNINNDSYLFLADIFFARRLIKHDMILWWSASAKPDLGGREEDENLYMIDELVNPEVNATGSYNTVCLEVDIIRLCVNTILESSLINELEGTDGGIGFDNVAHTLDDYNAGKTGSAVSFGDGTISAKTFSTLRTMVQGWFGEALDTGNRFAEMMIETLHRWLTSTNSSMYDPCLYGLVHGMMVKLFMQLVAEFKRLGSRIVYATFNKIIVATSKESIGSALAYGNYLLKAIMDKPLFEIIDLVPVHYWEQLLWMDSKNYGGVICPQLDAVVSEPSANAPAKEIERPTVHMQWNIQDYLPLALQKNFELIIAEFINEVYKYRMDLFSSTNGQSLVHNRASNNDEHGTSGDAVMFTKQLIGQHITRRLLRLVPEIQRRHSEAALDEETRVAFSFPILAGSHLSLTNPALEFVKFICATLALDNELAYEVRILRRNCFDLIGIREFAPEAQFSNPCEFFTLSQVICGYCNFCADLDFCRDRELLPHNGKLQIWRCKGCGMDYDKSFIEETLVIEVERRAMSYQLQDLKCSKCRQIKVDNLAKQCKCSGEFVITQSKSDFIKKMRIFMNVAKEQQLIFLEEVVNWVLTRC